MRGVDTVARLLRSSGPMITSGWEEQHGPMMMARATTNDTEQWLYEGRITQEAFDAWCDLRDEYRHGIPAPWSGLHQLIRSAVEQRMIEDAARPRPYRSMDARS